MNDFSMTSCSSEETQKEVFSWLREFNLEKNGTFFQSLLDGEEEEFFLVVRRDGGEVNGGLAGSFLHRWLKIDVMAVKPEFRGMGIGKELVLQAERNAIEKGCRYSYVDTMSYQAPEFYRKLGYAEQGRLRNWDSHGHDKVFLVKELAGKAGR